MHDNLIDRPTPLTYADFCKLPDDGRRYEILDGELFVSPSPIPLHQRIVGNLYFILRQHIRPNQLGDLYVAPLDVLLSEHNITEPDLLFVTKAKSAIITDKNVQGAPDLLIEVLSPSTRQRDLRKKRDIYGEWGVDWYWIIDPEGGSLLELQRVDKGYTETVRLARETSFTPKLFPGLSIDLDSLWD